MKVNPPLTYKIIQQQNNYPWPDKTGQDKNRTITVHKSDYLYKAPDGTFGFLTGFGFTGIEIPMKDVEVVPGITTQII